MLDLPRFLRLSDGRRLAFELVSGKCPGVLFCGGYTSDMTGTKARALEAFCRAQSRAFTRFDYSGHGASSGDFADGTIGAVGEDALAIVDRATAGPLLVVGSSMGGWIMLLVALARPERIAALIGVAAAPDFTADLLLPQATPEQRRALADQGHWMQPSAYGGDPYPVTHRLHPGGGRAPRAACAAPDPMPGPLAARPARPRRALADRTASRRTAAIR